ncbi:hypothetical protein HDE_04442 [Halotydeus destructor]|nr:hypothetical protein HDE_04442 [Halotydeus destructor]
MSTQGGNPNKNVNTNRGASKGPLFPDSDHVGNQDGGVQDPKNGNKNSSTVASQSNLTDKLLPDVSCGDQGQDTVNKNEHQGNENQDLSHLFSSFSLQPPRFNLNDNQQNSTNIFGNFQGRPAFGTSGFTGNSSISQDNSALVTQVQHLTTMMTSMQEMMQMLAVNQVQGQQLQQGSNQMAQPVPQPGTAVGNARNQEQAGNSSNSSANQQQSQNQAPMNQSQDSSNGSRNLFNNSAREIARELNSMNTRIKLASYDGSESFEKWLTKTRMLLQMNNVPRNEYISRIVNAIRKPASEKLDDVLTSLANEGYNLQGMDPEFFIARLTSIMDNAMEGPVALKALRDLKQGMNESAQDYMKRFSSVAVNVKISENDKMNHLILGLKSRLSHYILLKSETLTTTNYKSRIEIAEKYLDQLKKQEKREDYEEQRMSGKNKMGEVKINYADDTRMVNLNIAKVIVELFGIKMSMRICVVEHNNEPLIGMDVLQKFKIVLNIARRKMTCSRNKMTLYLQPSEVDMNAMTYAVQENLNTVNSRNQFFSRMLCSKEAKKELVVRLQEEVTIPANHTKHCLVSYENDDKEAYVIKTASGLLLKKQLMVPRGIIDKNVKSLPLTNYSNQEVTLNRKTKIAFGEQVVLSKNKKECFDKALFDRVQGNKSKQEYMQDVLEQKWSAIVINDVLDGSIKTFKIIPGCLI